MKLKFYMRGFGTGVLFATVILILAFAIKDNMPFKSAPSNSSGNVLKESKSGSDSQSLQKSESISELEKSHREEDTTAEVTAQVTEDTTAGVTTQADEETSDKITTQVPEKTSAEIITQIPAETTVNQPETVQSDTVSLNIVSGMSSNRVAEVLEKAGAVANGNDFNMYMYNNGYANKLRVGVYEIKKGASYEEIVKMITASR